MSADYGNGARFGPEMLPCDVEYASLQRYIETAGARKLFLVCGASADRLAIGNFFREASDSFAIVRFSDFSPNPDIASVRNGIRRFREERCDMLAALGGGSAIDVAKCIRLFADADLSKDILDQERGASMVPFLAIPTTAGSGSEATRFAVVYRNGEKQSVTDDRALPNATLLDPSVLASLPLYQKKTTMLDALCHAVESYWSVNSTEESREYAGRSISLIMENAAAYFCGNEGAYPLMMEAAHLAGRAINISRTTAGHAMCYKLTTNYGLAHGHAAALCVAALWPYMLHHMEDCVDPRGADHLYGVFVKLANIITGSSAAEAADGAARFCALVYDELKMAVPVIRESEIVSLAFSVNPDRLANHPIALSKATIIALYKEIADESGRTV